MAREKRTISIFCTDSRVGFYVSKSDFTEDEKHGYIDLDPNTIFNGKILEPELLFKKMQTMFKINKIKPKFVQFILSDHSLINREIIIKKEDLQKLDLDHYISQKINIEIHTPFKMPSYVYHVTYEDAAIYKVILVVANSDILHDYHDIFDRLGIKQVTFDIPSLAFYNAYLLKTKTPQSIVMLVSLYERQVSIKIIEEGTPVFSIIEESDDSAMEYFEMVENYVERISNYYRFNLKKGAAFIKHVVFFNFSEDITYKMLQDKLFSKLTDYEIEVIDILGQGDSLKAMPKVTQVALISSKVKDPRIKMYQDFHFHLERKPSINQVLNVILAISFFIFTGTLLVYLPFQTLQIDINTQQSINNNLQNQLEIVLRETPPARVYTQREIQYSNAYNFLKTQEMFYDTYVDHLFDESVPGMTIASFVLDQKTKTITLIIISDIPIILDEYIIRIYENYGIISNTSQSDRWMVSSPTTRTLSGIAREVKVTYA